MLEATIKTITSKKNGNTYTVIEITLPNGYKKVVFPKDSAEAFIFEQCM